MTDHLAPVSPSASDARPHWALWERIAFRYLCLHWLLYAFPSPLSSLPSTLASIWRWFLPEDGELPGWANDTLTTIGQWSGQPYQWWKDLTLWLYENDLTFGIQVIYQRTGSGDTGAAYVKFACIVLFSIVLTTIWSLLDRRKTGHPVLGRWVHLGARWYVGLILLSYGAAKFFGGQFAEPTISALTREVGDHSPMGLVWTFMGASQPYNYLAGIGEVASFALLLHRRTALFGCFVTVAVMSNVAAVNWFYGWPVKLYSGHLLLISVFLMAPYRHRLWALFVSNKSSEPVDMRVVRNRWLGWPLMFVGTVWGVGAAVNMYLTRSEAWNTRLETTFKKPELYGLWQVENMLLDGEQVSPTDALRWEHLIIDRGGRASAKTLLGQVHPFTCTEDLAANTVTMKTGTEEQVWTIERSTVQRKLPHPAPKTMEEYRSRVDRDVEAIVWRGKWDGKDLELHTVQKLFRLHDPFRMIREFPR